MLKEVKATNSLEALDVTIGVLNDICVPIKHKQIADSIQAAIGNLGVVKQLIEKEKAELTAKKEAETPEETNEETGGQEET